MIMIPEFSHRLLFADCSSAVAPAGTFSVSVLMSLRNEQIPGSGRGWKRFNILKTKIHPFSLPHWVTHIRNVCTYEAAVRLGPE